MKVTAAAASSDFYHTFLASGVEFAADVVPERQTVALLFRMLSGVADEPEDLNGVALILEQTLSKGTARYDGRGLADAFDQLGAQWSTACGRQSTLLRVVCLPEYAEKVVALAAELLARPTFPDEACRVAVELARTDLKQLEDDPDELLRVLIQRLTYGPVFGRYAGGTDESLARLTPEKIRAHWQATFHSGRLQVAVAGPVRPDALGERIAAEFAGLGSPEPAGRTPADFTFSPGRTHRSKELEQQYLALTLPGRSRDDEAFAVEQVLLGVLAGGMSGRLFTEVREKQGLVYWVGAWHEQPRGRGVIHVGASTTPERCDQTYRTLLRELERLREDLTEEEVARARESLVAHALMDDDLTRVRAGSLSDDLFHFGRPIGLGPKLAAVRAVTLAEARAGAETFQPEQVCVATLGPRSL